MNTIGDLHLHHFTCTLAERVCWKAVPYRHTHTHKGTRECSDATKQRVPINLYMTNLNAPSCTMQSVCLRSVHVPLLLCLTLALNVCFCVCVCVCHDRTDTFWSCLLSVHIGHAPRLAHLACFQFSSRTNERVCVCVNHRTSSCPSLSLLTCSIYLSPCTVAVQHKL